MKPKIEQLTDKEQQWLASQLESAAKFVAAFAPQEADVPPTLSALDQAFAAWLATNERDTDVINSTVNCIGAAFGQFLVDGIGLNWVIATDEHGSDLAVYGLPGKGDVLVYPANFVAKRWERGETRFLESAYEQIEQHVSTLAGADQSTKPWWKRW